MDLGYNSQPWCRFLGNLLRHFLRVDLLLVLTFWFHRYMLLSILILRAMTTKHKKLEGIYKITKIGIQIDKILRHVLLVVQRFGYYQYLLGQKFDEQVSDLVSFPEQS